MFDGGAQLSHVAGPVISEKRVHGVGSEFEQRFLIRFTEMAQKSADEKGNILLAIAQWRHGDADHVQAKKKIVAELSLTDEAFQIFVGGGDEADVRVQGLIATDPLKGAVFPDHAQ